LTAAQQSVTFRQVLGAGAGKMRMMIGAIGLLAVAALVPATTQAATPAQTAPAVSKASQAATDLSAQSRQRPLRRLRVYPRSDADDVYPRYFPGRNAVRDCTATYVQEYRPSGTVITPRMNCFWRPG
jgi:hypothetical protein